MDRQDEIEGLAILIRDLRKHKKVTLADLAQRIGRSVGFLSQVERGLSRPTVADLTAIGEALQTPTTYFYSVSMPRALPWVTRPVDDSDEQGGFVLEGELTIWLDENDEPVTLHANDSFQLPSRCRFRYANLAEVPARVLWVFT